MELLPQTWIVLSVFIISIIVHIAMIFSNQKYRQSVFKNSVLEKLMHFANIIVMAIVLSYSVQCSLRGSSAMPSCNTFAWFLTALVIVMCVVNIVCKIYMYVYKNKSKKKTAEEIEDFEEKYL